MKRPAYENFVWERPSQSDGYVWTKYKGEQPENERTVLTLRPGVGLEPYFPISGPLSLARLLATARDTPSNRAAEDLALLRFANEFGSFTDRGDGLKFWRCIAMSISEVIAVWDILREGNEAELAKRFVWDGDLIHYRPGGDKTPQAGSFGFDIGKPWPGVRKSRLIIPSGNFRAAASEFINEHLTEESIAGNRPSLAWNEKRRKFTCSEMPRDLLAAIFLQLAHAIRDGAEPRPCSVCGRAIDFAPGISRPDRQVCSSACRSRSYRARQDRARQFHAQGKSFKQIANELDSEVATVTRWIVGKR